MFEAVFQNFAIESTKHEVNELFISSLVLVQKKITNIPAGLFLKHDICF